MCDYKEMALEVVMSKIAPQTPHTQINWILLENPMFAALWSGHANCGRVNIGSERRPCTLL